MRCKSTRSPAAGRRYGGFFGVTRSRLKKALRAAEQERTDVARARRRWRREQGMFDPARLVFIDETSANTKMARLYGRCARRRAAGEPCAAGALENDHLGGGAAPAWHGASALTNHRRRNDRKEVLGLCPTMSRADAQAQGYRRHRQSPAHKVAGVRAAIEARGATLRYLPKYSPDLNPIEMSFSQLKADLRKAAERTIPRLRRRIARFVRSLPARHAANYFRHAGYA